MLLTQDMTREEYEQHIQYIKSFYPNKLMLLLQQNNFCIDDELLTYYINLGFNKFCVGSIEQAKQIKKFLPSAEVIASITMKITYEEFISNNELEIFDGFVLFFTFNRDLDLIKKLPKKYKYILLVNCGCNIHCDGTHHWFASRDFEEGNKPEQHRCPNKIKPTYWKDTIRIRPMDLNIFDPYISIYKLQGREYVTQRIITDLCAYAFIDYNAFIGWAADESIYKKSD